jgi:hypothetical protein
MKKFVPIVVILLLAAVGYLLGSQWRVLFPDGVDIAADPACDLAQGPCRTRLPDGGEVRLAVTPNPIPLMKPLSVEVSVSGSDLKPASLDITGLNMNMGLNRTPLLADGPNTWRGETVLPICTQRRMHWQAALVLQGDAGTFRLNHAFYTLRP